MLEATRLTRVKPVIEATALISAYFEVRPSQR